MAIPLSANRPRSAGGRGPRRPANTWLPRWSDELKLKDGETANIQITPAKYALGDTDVPYYQAALYQLKFINDNGNEAFGYFRGQEDGFCTLQAAADDGNPCVKPAKWGEPNRFFCNVIHYSIYSQKPAVDKTGKPKVYAEGKMKGKPVTYWTEAANRNERKNLLARLEAGGDEASTVSLFRKKFLSMSFGQFKLIQEIDRKARAMCKCGGTLFPLRYTCGSCQHILLDTENTDKSDAEVAEYGDQEIRCRKCDEVGYPKAEFECDKCDSPAPHQYHEVVVTIRREKGSNGFPTTVLDKIVPATEFVLANGACPVIDMKDTEDRSFEYEKEMADLMRVQYDFAEYTKPLSNAEYSKMLGLRERDAGFVAETKKYDKFR